ncbi:hypothetical protein [Aeromonas enterica]
MMNTQDWQICPVTMHDLDLSKDKLHLQWDQLHRGNREPFPTDERLQAAWRQYHLGNFAQAVNIGLELGGPGVVPAAFAATIYAQYVEQDEKRKIALFKQVIALCEEAEKGGLTTPNLHYIYAVAMGRYSLFISMVEALAQGFGGRIKEQVEMCLALDPQHSEAHVTYGGWHAAITDQAGALMGRMLYGATQDGAHEHYDEAVRLAPDSVVTHIEYARGLETMYGNSEPGIIEKLETALQLVAVDAMQRLDQEAARQLLARSKTATTMR